MSTTQQKKDLINEKEKLEDQLLVAYSELIQTEETEKEKILIEIGKITENIERIENEIKAIEDQESTQRFSYSNMLSNLSGNPRTDTVALPKSDDMDEIQRLEQLLHGTRSMGNSQSNEMFLLRPSTESVAQRQPSGKSPILSLPPNTSDHPYKLFNWNALSTYPSTTWPLDREKIFVKESGVYFEKKCQIDDNTLVAYKITKKETKATPSLGVQNFYEFQFYNPATNMAHPYTQSLCEDYIYVLSLENIMDKYNKRDKTPLPVIPLIYYATHNEDGSLCQAREVSKKHHEAIESDAVAPPAYAHAYSDIISRLRPDYSSWRNLEALKNRHRQGLSQTVQESQDMARKWFANRTNLEARRDVKRLKNIAQKMLHRQGKTFDTKEEEKMAINRILEDVEPLLRQKICESHPNGVKNLSTFDVLVLKHNLKSQRSKGKELPVNLRRFVQSELLDRIKDEEYDTHPKTGEKEHRYFVKPRDSSISSFWIDADRLEAFRPDLIKEWEAKKSKTGSRRSGKASAVQEKEEEKETVLLTSEELDALLSSEDDVSDSESYAGHNESKDRKRKSRGDGMSLLLSNYGSSSSSSSSSASSPR